AAPGQVDGGAQQQGDAKQNRGLRRPPVRIAESGHESSLHVFLLWAVRHGVGEFSLGAHGEAASRTLAEAAMSGPTAAQISSRTYGVRIRRNDRPWLLPSRRQHRADFRSATPAAMVCCCWTTRRASAWASGPTRS